MMFKRLFWISEERRPGALWRIGLEIVLMIVLYSFFKTVMIILPQFLGSHLSAYWPLLEILRFLNQFVVLIPILGSIWLVGRFLDGRPFSDFGLHLNRDWWLDFGFGLALGAFLMSLIFLTEWSAGWIAVTGTFATPAISFPFWLAIFYQFVQFISVGIQEEMFIRGYPLRNLAEGFAKIPGLSSKTAILLSLILSSIIFGLIHLGNPNTTWVSTLDIALGGILLGLGYILTGELAISIALHITWNFFQGNVFGFPVSGITQGVSFLTIQQGGPSLFTGGAFGPEAGLVGLAAITLGSVLIVVYVRWRYGTVSLHEALAVPNFLPRKQQRLAIRAGEVERESPVDEESESSTKL